MLFYKKIQFIFKILGMCPTSLSSRHSKTYILSLWSLVQIAIISFICVIASWNTRAFSRESPVNVITSLLKEVLVFGVHFTIIIQSLVSRRNFQKFWEEIENVNAITSKFEDANKTKVNWKQKLTYIAYFMVSIILSIIILVSFTKDLALLHHWCCMFISMLISCFHHMQFVFYLETIYIFLGKCTHELRKIVEQSKYNRSVFERAMTDSNDLLHNFNQVRKVYHQLWITHEIVNKIFGFGLMLNIAFMFVSMLCDLYWIYVSIYNNTFIHIIGKIHK